MRFNIHLPFAVEDTTTLILQAQKIVNILQIFNSWLDWKTMLNIYLRVFFFDCKLGSIDRVAVLNKTA